MKKRGAYICKLQLYTYGGFVLETFKNLKNTSANTMNL